MGKIAQFNPTFTLIELPVVIATSRSSLRSCCPRSIGRRTMSLSRPTRNRFCAAVVDSRSEVNHVIFKVNQAIDSFRILVDYLESAPGVLLRGKERPRR